MAATVLGRAPNNKGNIAIAAATQAVIITAGQKANRFTFSCDQQWFFTFTPVGEGDPLGSEKNGPIDAGRWFEIRIDSGVQNQSIYIEAVATATLQAIVEPA